ncbi:MAG: asparagine synthase (glutamine-hydrolyzing) [Patescibacteria group bacterium]|nr:asparagine synthase (glutamine-hydrolyzing) [Patescibacteria group bacterium]MDD4304270.1 asparagine synthase (glutamine-hydrolyzing) [Patescibacteria group bacterium]MDD4695324.1 asparagine synthase (glutamine-hydrolyzing) [Patescibacteria group bacterium]
MCGINGFNFSDQNLIEKMNKKIEYRGPDDTGIFVDNEISLGHNRLSIIDLSQRGHQPMESDDKNYIITYNGELYNFKEIKKDLENNGFHFHSDTDTEVILNSYIAYGEKCLEKFNGIFVFAIWDKKNKKLFIARDNFGVKPLFYYFKDNKFIFSSEIKGILEHDIDKQISIDALNLYFRFLYIAGPITIFEYIKKLQPGHFLIFKENKIEIKKYHNLPTEQNECSYEEAKNIIRKKFDKAVEGQLISDRPLGIFLSGGIDSTAILGSMSKIVKNKIKTFTVKFDVDTQEEKFNMDSILARKNSEFYNTEHHELLITAQDVTENLEKVVYHMDDLVSNHIQVATYLLSKEAKKYVDVVLGGDGGDEIFGGYDRYYYYNLVDKWQNIPKLIRDNKFTYNVAKIFGKESEYYKLNSQSGIDLFWQFSAQKENIIKRFLKHDVNNLNKSKEIINNNYFDLLFKNYANYLMKVDFCTWLTDESLSRSDKMSMAFALEERVPILDKELVDFAFSIPISYKLGNKHQGKKIFKEAIKDYLPDYIYNKQKTGWFSPTSKWLRTDLKEIAYEILSPNYNPDTKQFFDFYEIKKILDNHINYKEYALNTIWSLITFQIWYKQNFK